MRRSISIWLESDRRFTTLVSLIKLAGLYHRLNEPGLFTLFAVQNYVFEQLGSETFQKIIDQPKGSIRKDLAHHIVPGLYNLESLVHGRMLYSEAGNKIHVVNINGMIRINGRTLTEGNKITSNGIVHVVNALL